MSLNNINNAAIAEMLIRKPINEVFEAFINPEVTSKFWFTKSTGKLEPDKYIEWTWEMYNHTVIVFVKSIEINKTIIIEWGNYQDKSIVEWSFKEYKDNTTFVSIVNSGFQGDIEQIISQIRDSTEGFTMVLAGLKAYLEYKIQLNLIRDRFPNEINKLD
jgi:uncharacterized protein YndB with AHSA1/START domain